MTIFGAKQQPTTNDHQPNASTAGVTDFHPRNVYVACLPRDFTDIMLRDLFARFGEIISAKTMRDAGVAGRCKGYGFVLFAEESAASLAIQEMLGHKINGELIQVRRARNSTGGRQLKYAMNELPEPRYQPTTTKLPPPVARKAEPGASPVGHWDQCQTHHVQPHHVPQPQCPNLRRQLTQPSVVRPQLRPEFLPKPHSPPCAHSFVPLPPHHHVPHHHHHPQVVLIPVPAPFMLSQSQMLSQSAGSGASLGDSLRTNSSDSASPKTSPATAPLNAAPGTETWESLHSSVDSTISSNWNEAAEHVISSCDAAPKLHLSVLPEPTGQPKVRQQQSPIGTPVHAGASSTAASSPWESPNEGQEDRAVQW